MRALLATAAVAALSLSTPLFAKAHPQPSSKADFGQNTAAAAIAKNDDKSMKSSKSTTKSATTTTKSSPSKPKS